MILVDIQRWLLFSSQDWKWFNYPVKVTMVSKITKFICMWIYIYHQPGYANLSFLWYSPKMMQSLLTRLVFQKLIFWLSTHTSFVLFVHCSPLFAVAPDFLHQLNGGLWFHGNFHLHLNFKSSSTNLCVANKGKAETIFVTFCLQHDIIFFILLKTSKHSSFSISTKIVPYAFRVPKCTL